MSQYDPDEVEELEEAIKEVLARIDFMIWKEQYEKDRALKQNE